MVIHKNNMTLEDLENFYKKQVNLFEDKVQEEIDELRKLEISKYKEIAEIHFKILQLKRFIR